MKMCFITLRMDKPNNGIPLFCRIHLQYRRENPFYLWDQNICTSEYIPQNHKTENPCILPFELKQLLPIGRSMHPDHLAKRTSEPKASFYRRRSDRTNICIIFNHTRNLVSVLTVYDETEQQVEARQETAKLSRSYSHEANALVNDHHWPGEKQHNI